MLKVKDFVFALLTLICVSPIVGEERTIFPKAKEWPKYAGFEWGMSEDKFFEACAAKKLARVFNQELGKWVGKGMILGKDAEVEPIFERREGKRPNCKGVSLAGITIMFQTKKSTYISAVGRHGEKFFDDLHRVLKDKYGPSKRIDPTRRYYGWGAPDMPHMSCLRILGKVYGHGSWNKEEPKWEPDGSFSYRVWVSYASKSRVEYMDNWEKKKSAEKRELEKKAKEDEKDF